MPEFGVVLTGVFTMVLLLVPGFIFEKSVWYLRILPTGCLFLPCILHSLP